MRAARRVPFRPIRDVAELYEPLDDRVMAGFGGVAEYGITVRWDKNFLKLIRLLLERRREFAMFGGVRFGGTLTIDGAFALGFDHIALCAGAGRPTVVPMKNGLAARRAPGLRLPDGAAAHRRRQDRQPRQPAGAAAGGGDRRRADRDRHRDRVAGLLPAAGREVPAAATRRWSPSAARRRCAPTGPPRKRRPRPSSSTHARAIRAERAAAAREGRQPRLAELLRSGAAPPSPTAAG